jgi:subtilase family serine protease
MKFQLIICFSLIFHLNALKNKTRTKLKDSYGHKGHKLAKIGPLDKESKLTLTLVTGSLNNSQLVADYYSSFGKNLTIYEQTNMHVKLKGKVSFLSQLFNTTFIEYKCDNHTEINDAQRKRQKCYASNSEVSIPETLKSSIIGIMGLEQVFYMKPNFKVKKSKVETFSSNDDLMKPAASSSYFIPTQVASIYGFPSGTGAGIRIGGYFKQSDLQSFFTRFSLGTAPTINIVYVDGAQFDFNDVNNDSRENYLDLEIIAFNSI